MDAAVMPDLAEEPQVDAVARPDLVEVPQVALNPRRVVTS